MNKPTHEEQLCQPLKSNVTKFEKAVTVLNSNNGILT